MTMDRGTIAMARFIARNEVKTEIRRRGHKLQHYSAKQITEWVIIISATIAMWS
jgi:hypothetical protein